MDAPRHIALSGRLAAETADRLGSAFPELEARVVDGHALTAEELAWADAYCGFHMPANLGESRVRWVHLTAAGVDQAVPFLRSLPTPPLLTRTVGTMPEKIAAYVVAHVLAEYQHLAWFRERQARRRWEVVFPESQVGRTAVVLGTGRIGSAIATALRGVGFAVAGVSRGGAAKAAFDTVVTPATAEPAYRRAAVVVSTLPLTDETRHATGAGVFGSLDRAIFVNVGRGATVDEGALREALDAGRLRLAVLDVFETEPLPAESWLWAHERVVVTPHIAGITDVDDVFGEFASAYESLKRGEWPGNGVDLGRGY